MMAIPPVVLALAVVVLGACIVRWVLACRTEAELDRAVDEREAALAAGAEARAQIRAMRARHAARLDASRIRWVSEPDTTELGLVDHVARAEAAGWWLR